MNQVAREELKYVKENTRSQGHKRSCADAIQWKVDRNLRNNE